MSDLNTLVSGIDYKVRKLVGQLERSETEKKQLRQEKVDLQAQVEQQRDNIRQLEDKILKMNMAGALVSKTETGNVKQKINQMVREIDRCLALLNK